MRPTVIALLATTLLGLVLAGCTPKEMDNSYDASKLPPMPTDGRGPKAAGAGSAGGAPETAPAAPAAPAPVAPMQAKE